MNWVKEDRQYTGLRKLRLETSVRIYKRFASLDSKKFEQHYLLKLLTV